MCGGVGGGGKSSSYQGLCKGPRAECDNKSSTGIGPQGSACTQRETDKSQATQIQAKTKFNRQAMRVQNCFHLGEGCEGKLSKVDDVDK